MADQTANWKTAYLESRILSADPVELIAILYEHAIFFIQDAREYLANGDIAARSKAISKAIAIIGELEASLDHEIGGAISRNLARLYQYMRERLVAANMRQEAAPLIEVEGLLKTVGEAWRAICAHSVSAPDPIEAEVTPGTSLGIYPGTESPDAYTAHGWSG